jgi:inhibitor of KinA sporulation pathway (predicted exonuclease)
MSKLLDAIVVVDLESTCWEGEPPPGEMSEIIEIGVTLLDLASLKRTDKRSMLVRPESSQVSPFCTALTTIEPGMLAGAPPLADAVRVLKREFKTKDRLWASWGDYDRRQFERSCAESGTAYPFGPGHLNVKTLFATARALEREVALDGAFAILGWQMEGTHHRGADDAWNIARVLADLYAKLRA